MLYNKATEDPCEWCEQLKGIKVVIVFTFTLYIQSLVQRIRGADLSLVLVLRSFTVAKTLPLKHKVKYVVNKAKS